MEDVVVHGESFIPIYCLIAAMTLLSYYFERHLLSCKIYNAAKIVYFRTGIYTSPH
tara:strand:+ start:148 stop:315 length:168 start_codon:yes stop_codon:yes gene_type:complete